MIADLVQGALWCGLLAALVIACVGLRAVGIGRTYVRDLLHVGAGVWILGWRAWRGAAVPMAITVAAVVGVALVPVAARRVRALRAFRDSVAGGDERWLGILLYTASFAIFTWTALHGALLPSAAGLASLALGDGVGGLVGRRWGRRYYRVPGGKRKSFEGSATVALFAAVGVVGAALWLGLPITAGVVAVAALTAAVVEALAPRSSDNLLIPVAVFAIVRWLGGAS